MYGQGRHWKNRGRRGRVQHHDTRHLSMRTLDRVRPGETFEVTEVGDERARVNALRFGMAEGACLDCVTRIPAGPIIVRVGRQEIAVGRKLARRIHVRDIQSDDAPDAEQGVA